MPVKLQLGLHYSSQQASSCRASIPSFPTIGIITNAATGSAHHQPKILLAALLCHLSEHDREEMDDQRGTENAGHDCRSLVARREGERDELCLVAHFGDQDENKAIQNADKLALL